MIQIDLCRSTALAAETGDQPWVAKRKVGFWRHLLYFTFARIWANKYIYNQNDHCFSSGILICEDCALVPSVETSKIFNETIDDKIIFLYLKFNFMNATFNSTEFIPLRNTLNVIDSLTWVLAIGGNGELLLQSPFDCRYASLGALSASGVNGLKGSRIGHSVKVSLWGVSLLINIRFRFFCFRISNC